MYFSFDWQKQYDVTVKAGNQSKHISNGFSYAPPATPDLEPQPPTQTHEQISSDAEFTKIGTYMHVHEIGILHYFPWFVKFECFV